MNYEKKYLKYKNKYLSLKKQIGGYLSFDELQILLGPGWKNRFTPKAQQTVYNTLFSLESGASNSCLYRSEKLPP